MGLTSSRGKRPARLHSSMIGTRLSSMNLRVVSRTRRSSSLSRESKAMKSTPRNLMADICVSPRGQQFLDGKLFKVAEGRLWALGVRLWALGAKLRGHG